MNDTNKQSAIRALYATLPALECKRLCHGSCGPVPMSRLEARAIGEPTENIIGLGRVMLVGEDGKCPILKAGCCSKYDDRPALCRLFGLNEKLRCPHGCEPERMLTEKESHAFLAEVQRLGY